MAPTKNIKLGYNTGYWGSGPPAGALEGIKEADRLGFDSVWTAEAYGSDAITPLAWIAAQDDHDDSLFLIGHNPALTELINELAVCRQLDNLPTAGYVRLLLDVQTWSAIECGCATLEQSLFPKELPAT